MMKTHSRPTTRFGAALAVLALALVPPAAAQFVESDIEILVSLQTEAAGDVFGWVEETQNVGFSDAVELLARRAGLDITQDPEAAKRKDRRERLVDAVERAAAFYHERL